MSGLVVLHLVDDVRLDEDADHAVVLDHRQPTNLPISHLLERLIEGGTWAGSNPGQVATYSMKKPYEELVEHPDPLAALESA